ncbi:patatin-like phospholipase family protein [Ruania zhangjianzhongii]|uniref:patatin-like phospholipase family protein n=1 Tax=Ruania zhangjianzhongii TaxID=2603206 RepID=UPI00143D84DB|nr:patatin-like phospholipase family protein [Ruania zhangjianzhongii]
MTAEQPHPADGVGSPGRRTRLAIVIGSGGVKCAAAVGMWRVLQREGIRPDLVVGCSGGSLYAAAMALGMDAREAEAHSFRMWHGLFSRVHYRSLLRSLLPGRLGFSERMGLVDDRGIETALAELYGDAGFADTRIPLHIAATDLHSGERVGLSSGTVSDAVRASIAMPLLLRPWPIAGRLLVDGGVSDPLPISLAIREGADIILAMGFETPALGKMSSLLGVARQSLSMTTNHLLRSTYAFYSAVHHAEIVPIMPEFETPISVTDTDRIPDIIDRGERATLDVLPYLRQLGLVSAEVAP